MRRGPHGSTSTGDLSAYLTRNAALELRALERVERPPEERGQRHETRSRHEVVGEEQRGQRRCTSRDHEWQPGAQRNSQEQRESEEDSAQAGHPPSCRRPSAYPNVIVLLDDSEGTLPAHSYDKLLGLAELSDTDRRNKASGKDTTVDRSRRLLYVCVSRARNELAVVLYAMDVDAAILSLKAAGLADQPLTMDDLSAT
ncbi:hypothetical protein O7627_32990 [Solwaraspora sp. WMMD1047]|uniref:hypothetical protein n=1 Tax=Solwaraspora sp. WMMD1047 TaxID=3016102 RepID=UPI002415DB2D|nr:hypothetical protein [Solwaraspora sp. WMMD1047]MDG4834082.1 hypothetical protein [Solwaraspora sp. WMMD1047]